MDKLFKLLSGVRRSHTLISIITLLIAILLLAWLMDFSARQSGKGGEENAITATSLTAPQAVPSAGTKDHSPPWRYGKADARFTLIEYADLECPGCQAYFTMLQNWVKAHPDINWQWQHMPLPMHEPAATQSAKLAECMGEVSGVDAFWQATQWIYQHTRGNGQGLSPEARLPGLSSHKQAALDDCLQSNRADQIIQTQVQEAQREGITATPSLKLIDNHSGQTLIIHGPAEEDALLSAMDWLVAQEEHNVRQEP